MLKTNVGQLILTAVEGRPVYPSINGWRVSHDGHGVILPGVGGISHNLKLGDSAYGWVADHAEPCVSATASYEHRERGMNLAFNYYACVGNQARLLSGEAKGAMGVVTGTHGGCEHVMIDFPDAVLERMSLDDKIQILAFGQGLRLIDFPEVKIWSLAPDVLQQMKIEPDLEAKQLRIPVTALVPHQLLGSGLGRTDGFKADIDLQTSDQTQIISLKLDQLKLGDFVALMDTKSYYGWSFATGAVTIGVVTHTDSVTAGHGPGITTLMTAEKGEILPLVQPEANLGRYLKIGRFR